MSVPVAVSRDCAAWADATARKTAVKNANRKLERTVRVGIVHAENMQAFKQSQSLV